MANNLRKFNTYSDYEAAELVKPAVSLIAATDEVIFDQKDAPVPPTFSGLTVHYNITDISQPTELFRYDGGSGSGSGSGGVLPSAMIIDGTAVEVTNTYQFSTTGEHIVNYSFADNQIPEHFLDDDEYTGKFSALTKVEIGDAITSIGESAFRFCTSLTSIVIPDSVTSIGNRAFSFCSGLTSIVIPDSVTSIGMVAFSHCTSLTSIVIPDSVTSIGQQAFEDCTSLTSIVIPDSVTSIGFMAFYSCSGLTSIVIPDSVTSIGDYAFYGCEGLTNCTIGSGVTSIGDEAFSQCSCLTSITSNPMTAPTLGNNTFSSISYNGVLTVPSGSQGYCGWIGGGELPSYWTIEGVTCE